MHRGEERKEGTTYTDPTRQGSLLAGKRAHFCSEWTVPERGTLPGKRELMAYRKRVSVWDGVWASGRVAPDSVFRLPDLHTWDPALPYWHVLSDP